MISKLISLIPRDWLVFMYKKMPFKGLKNWIVYRAQNKFLVAVLGVITNDKGQVLLLKHNYRDEPWGIPGGWMELEQPQKGLEREIKEETGLEVKITNLAKALYGNKPDRVDLYFKGRIIEGMFIPNSEISEIYYCNIGDWPEGLPIVQRNLINEILSDNAE